VPVIRRNNCVFATLGTCYSVWMTVCYVGWTSNMLGGIPPYVQEELSDLYSLPNIVRVVKSRMRWAGHVARMGQGRGLYRVLVGKPE